MKYKKTTVLRTFNVKQKRTVMTHSQYTNKIIPKTATAYSWVFQKMEQTGKPRDNIGDFLTKSELRIQGNQLAINNPELNAAVTYLRNLKSMNCCQLTSLPPRTKFNHTYIETKMSSTKKVKFTTSSILFKKKKKHRKKNTASN